MRGIQGRIGKSAGDEQYVHTPQRLYEELTVKRDEARVRALVQMLRGIKMALLVYLGLLVRLTIHKFPPSLEYHSSLDSGYVI
jgi:hypothetical protein